MFGSTLLSATRFLVGLYVLTGFVSVFFAAPVAASAWSLLFRCTRYPRPEHGTRARPLDPRVGCLPRSSGYQPYASCCCSSTRSSLVSSCFALGFYLGSVYFYCAYTGYQRSYGYSFKVFPAFAYISGTLFIFSGPAIQVVL